MGTNCLCLKPQLFEKFLKWWLVNSSPFSVISSLRIPYCEIIFLHLLITVRDWEFLRFQLGTWSNTSPIKFAKSYNSGFYSGFPKLNFPKVMLSQIIQNLCLGLEHSLPKLHFIRSSNLTQVTSYLCRLYFSRLHFFYKKRDRENIVIISNIVLLRNYSSSYSIH